MMPRNEVKGPVTYPLEGSRSLEESVQSGVGVAADDEKSTEATHSKEVSASRICRASAC